jgi:hypothetical protein
MPTTRVRISVRFNREDIVFLDAIGFDANLSEGVRFCIRICRIYGVHAIKILEYRIGVAGTLYLKSCDHGERRTANHNLLSRARHSLTPF